MIAFLDETGLMLQPVRRRTWAPRGETPIQNAWDRHDRLSAIGVITLSAQRQRLSFYFQLLEENVCTENLTWFLIQMHRHFGRKIVLIWDRSPVHRSTASWFNAHHPDWFHFEWLPAYAPELNPVEQCWNHTKYSDLANFIPDDIRDLHDAAASSMSEKRSNQQFLRSCFEYAGLDLS